MSKTPLVGLIQRICLYYPEFERLSESRLVQTTFLIDWRSVILTGQQVTEIEWKSDQLGPWSSDVMDAVAANPALFRIHVSKSLFGTDRRTIQLISTRGLQHFDPDTEIAFTFVMNHTSLLDWDQFLDVVSMTYPVATQMYLGNPDVTLDLDLLHERRQKVLAVDREISSAI